MKNAFVARWRKPFAVGFSVLSFGMVAGCGNSEIKTYKVAKEDNTPKIGTQTPDAADASMMAGHGNTTVPNVSWTLPKGWRALPQNGGGLTKWSFEIPDAD